MKMNLTFFRRPSRFPTPVPPIKRSEKKEEPEPLSEETKTKLLLAAVLRTKNWTS